MIWFTARPGHHVDGQVHALAAGRLQHLIGPFLVARVDREVGAELLQPRAARIVGRRADHGLRALHLGDLQAHQADAGACALDQHALAGLEAALA